MKLISLELLNIRSHKESKIDFSDSLLLVGDIGSGKSTILQAVEFALFGIQRGFLDANHILRQGEDEGQVNLTIELNTKEIQIKRVLKKTKTSIKQEAGSLTINEETETFAPTELTSKIAELLGYPPNVSQVFRYSVYATQEQMKSIILEKPEARLNTLRIIFNIDKYKNIIENSNLSLRQIRKKIAYLEGAYSDLTEKKLKFAELKASKSSVESTTKSMQTDFSNAKQVVENKEKGLSELNEELNKLIIKEQELKSLKSHNESNVKKIESLKNSKESLDREITDLLDKRSKIIIPEVTFNYDELKTKLNSSRELFDRNNQLKQNLNSKLELINSQIVTIEKEILEFDAIKEKVTSEQERKKSLESKLNDVKSYLHSNVELEERFKDARVKEASIKDQIKSKEKEFTKIIDLNNCPTCLQKVDETHKNNLKKRLESEINELQEKLTSLKVTDLTYQIQEYKLKLSAKDSLDKELFELNSNLSNYSEKVEKLSEKKNNLKDLLEEKDKLDKKLDIINQFDFEKQKQDIDKIEIDLEQISKIELLKKDKDNIQEIATSKQSLLQSLTKEKESLDAELEEQNSKINILEKELLPLKEKRNLFDDFQKELKQIKIDFDSKQITLEKSLKELEMLNLQIESLKKEIESKELSKQKADWNKHIKSWLSNFYIPLIKSIEKRVLVQIYQEFNQIFKNWFNLLLEDEAITAEVDEQFTPKVYQNGYDLDIDSLSGGERTTVALAYRLALNKIVNQLLSLKTKDLLILDEPTEGFSTEQLDRVKYVLDELNIPQLILVSHEAKVGSFVSQVLTIEKHNSESKVN